MITALVFDFDSTLVDYTFGDKKAMSTVYSSISCNDTFEAFYEKSGEIVWDFYKSNLDFGSAIHEMRIRKTLDLYRIPYKHSYLDSFLDVYLSCVLVYSGCESILRFLKGKVKLGILTNSVDPVEQRKRILASGLSAYFDHIAIAKEIGFYKPDAKAFSAILDKLSVKADSTIFIGDSEYYDIGGAKNAGLKSIRKMNESLKTTKADFSFSEYSDLLNILIYSFNIN